ncbi:membrane fusion protein, multidrug efflux system [Flavobacteriaceae bacterium MAR_2010_188]|nr:membrane fusion protein, multidrug efflux system [Flavobacteriaceae bacterium MAR_2010_188]
MKFSTFKYIKLFAIVLAAAFFTSCEDSKDATPQGAQEEALPFEVSIIPQRTVTAYATYPATIEGIINSEVRAKISGYITDVLVDEGEKVKKGQTLFKLETQSLNQDAAAARANVNAAQVEVDKLVPLVEKNIISNVQLETAKAKLQQAKSGYSGIAANIDYGNIKSPVDGFVGSVELRKGSLISPSDQRPLTTVSDISKVYAYFSLNEKDYLDFIQNAEGNDIAEKIEKMPKVQLILANGSLYDQEGKIETINSQVNANTGTITFRAVFDNPSRLLTNGNSGKIKIPKTYTDAVVVPKESTIDRQGSTYVYLVGAENMAVASKISIEAEVDNLYVVSAGLKAGDKIVVTGVSKLRGETKIIPNEVSFDTLAKPIDTVFK